MNLPNKLSILRIVLVPIMMFFYLATFIPYGIGKWIAAVIFIVAALTDRLDGKIARSRKQITDLGKLLDPIADKLLLTCGLMLIVVDQTILQPFGIIGLAVLIARDILVNALRQIGSTKGIVFAATLSGKLKAIFHYIYIPTFMVVAGLFSAGLTTGVWSIIILVLEIISYTIFAIATGITIWSAIDYTVQNKKLLEEKKKEEQMKEQQNSNNNEVEQKQENTVIEEKENN